MKIKLNDNMSIDEFTALNKWLYERLGVGAVSDEKLRKGRDWAIDSKLKHFDLNGNVAFSHYLRINDEKLKPEEVLVLRLTYGI